MNVIETLFPMWALKRKQAAGALKAYYEAAKPSRYRERRTGRASGNQTVREAADHLRVQARHLEENHDLAKGILDTLVANVVGTGIRPEPQVKGTNGDLADDVNAAILKAWNLWIQRPEVTGTLDFYAAQRLACRSWFRDGEVFTQLIMGRGRAYRHPTDIPFAIELIESDYVPLDHESAQDNLVAGIQRNGWNQPVWYYLYKFHPHDQHGFATKSDLKRIKADKMVHLKMTSRVDQARGVTVFHSVLGRLDDIKEIEESERIAARVAAAMTGYIKKGNPDLYIDSGEDDYRELEMEPGMIFDDLLPGEDVGTIASNRPNNALIPFRDSMMRAIAAGTGTGYSSISKNYNGTYAAQRQELVEQHGIYGIFWSQFVESWVRPIWKAFIDSYQLAGMLQGSYDSTSIYDVEFSRPALPWIDPFKEATASERLVAGGFASRSQIIRSHGKNPDEVMRQIVKERREAEEAGVAFSTDGGNIVQPQQQVTSEAKDGESEEDEDSEDREDGE